METASLVEFSSMAATDEIMNVQHDGAYGHNPVSDRSLPDVKIFANNELTPRERIGSGGFGVVYRRAWREKKFMLVAEKQMTSDRALEK